MSGKKLPPPVRRAGRLTVSGTFRQFVLDQLEELGDVAPRAMFGCVGLYRRGIFFGIVAGDVLYLKVDDSTRTKFEAAGSTPFEPYADDPMSTSYYSVPVEVLESAPTLVEWARRAVIAAGATKPKPGAKSRTPTSAARPAKRR
jgi:DNA transformation protein